MEKDFFGEAKLEHFKNSCPVLALDEYKKDQGQDEFSRKQVWFHVYGDDEIEEEFYHGLKDMIESRFQNDDINWDLITLYPTHVKGKVNQHMDALLKRISKETGIEYRNVIERTKTIDENHELDSANAKAVNVEGTATCEDVEGMAQLALNHCWPKYLLCGFPNRHVRRAHARASERAMWVVGCVGGWVGVGRGDVNGVSVLEPS